MRNIRARLVKLESKSKAQQSFKSVRVCFQPDDCPDPEEFWRQADAEADADGVQLIQIVFVGPEGNPDEGMPGDYSCE